MKKKNLTDKEVLEAIHNWAFAWRKIFLEEKTELVIVSRTDMINKMNEVLQRTTEAL